MPVPQLRRTAADRIALSSTVKLVLGLKFEYSTFTGWDTMPNVRMLRDDEIEDPGLRELLRQATERGAPDPNFFRIMGHVPELARKTYEVWHEAFNRGALDH